jgi:hypothetical protein
MNDARGTCPEADHRMRGTTMASTLPEQRIDLLTIAGLAALLVPLLTMWHEIGGHAAACAVQGGHVATIGAFYVECTGLPAWPQVAVACAGVVVNASLAIAAHRASRLATGDLARLILWFVWVGEAMVAAGYFCFSGVTGFGDPGTGTGGSLAALPYPLAIRGAEVAFGIAAYVWIVRLAIRGLTRMLGDARSTAAARKRIAHGYYATAGVVSVIVGLLNPVGFMITILSAAASSFGGLAGMISIGFAVPRGSRVAPFTVRRNWPVVVAGAAMALAFAAILGPSIDF